MGQQWCVCQCANLCVLMWSLSLTQDWEKIREKVISKGNNTTVNAELVHR